jgi:hypothetical protein
MAFHLQVQYFKVEIQLKIGLVLFISPYFQLQVCKITNSSDFFATIFELFCRSYLSQKNVIEKLEDGVSSGRHAIMVENTFHLLSYVRTFSPLLKSFYLLP